MKKILFSLLIVIAVFAVYSPAQDNPLMKGTEKHQFNQQGDTGNCFVFSKYIVKTKTGDDTGEDIMVYNRTANQAASKGCKPAGNPYLTIKNPDSNYFFGLSDDYLFIDSGTGASVRGLEIYNLKTKKSVLTAEYHEIFELLPNNIVLFDKTAEKNGLIKNCKQAAKIKRDGMTIGWVQDTKFDLKTLKKLSVGALRCVAME